MAVATVPAFRVARFSAERTLALPSASPFKWHLEGSAVLQLVEVLQDVLIILSNTSKRIHGVYCECYEQTSTISSRRTRRWFRGSDGKSRWNCLVAAEAKSRHARPHVHRQFDEQCHGVLGNSSIEDALQDLSQPARVAGMVCVKAVDTAQS
jgi:hypothetical protein